MEELGWGGAGGEEGEVGGGVDVGVDVDGGGSHVSESRLDDG